GLDEERSFQNFGVLQQCCDSFYHLGACAFDVLAAVQKSTYHERHACRTEFGGLFERTPVFIDGQWILFIRSREKATSAIAGHRNAGILEQGPRYRQSRLLDVMPPRRDGTNSARVTAFHDLLERPLLDGCSVDGQVSEVRREVSHRCNVQAYAGSRAGSWAYAFSGA